MGTTETFIYGSRPRTELAIKHLKNFFPDLNVHHNSISREQLDRSTTITTTVIIKTKAVSSGACTIKLITAVIYGFS
jgi:hypothetical protein